MHGTPEESSVAKTGVTHRLLWRIEVLDEEDVAPPVGLANLCSISHDVRPDRTFEDVGVHEGDEEHESSADGDRRSDSKDFRTKNLMAFQLPLPSL